MTGNGRIRVLYQNVEPVPESYKKDIDLISLSARPMYSHVPNCRGAQLQGGLEKQPETLKRGVIINRMDWKGGEINKKKCNRPHPLQLGKKKVQ